MFLSKNSITLLSSIGASSIPVVSVVALYKIKSFSQGNDLESVSSNATVENVISDVEATKPEVKEEVKTTVEPEKPKATEPEEPKTVDPVVDPKPAPSEVSPQKPNDKNDDSANTNTESEKKETAEEVAKRLQKIADDLAKSLLENNEQKSDEDIVKNIDEFVELLTTQKSSITDATEKESATQVIDALNSLKGKIKKKD